MDQPLVIFALLALVVAFALGAIRARRVLSSAVWLAGASALLAVVFFLYGARRVAVIELSVGAGLVTVLFVFAISISGEQTNSGAILPVPFTIGVVLLFSILLGWFALPISPIIGGVQVTDTALSDVLWGQRGLDVLVQVVLIFAGALGLLGLLAESRPPLDGAIAREVSKRRERELQDMEAQLLGKGGSRS
jgi:uncharacterized MnhB-related membrane protein